PINPAANPQGRGVGGQGLLPEAGLRSRQGCDHSGDERLEEQELEKFCRRLLRRPELEELFGHYSGEDQVLSAEELQDFLRDQGEEATPSQARAAIQAYELNQKAREQDLMTLDGFMMYLLSAAGDILNQEHTKVHQDMNQPLSHYFISSSHNTYLTHHQVGGSSSTEAYVRALLAGCRCVELDCWEGPAGEPLVCHGHALTSKILFRDVIESIRDHAFKEEEEEEEKLQERSRRREASQVAPELSAMVVYSQAVPFPGLAQALCHPQPCQVSSFSERKARKLIKEAGPPLGRLHTRQLSRVYPLGLKMDSSNYNPQEMWNMGFQLVALNFQTPGYEMDLNTGRFLGNGACGYVLKPPSLRSPPGGPAPPMCHPCPQVISAQQLPKVTGQKDSAIVDPLVRVELHGVPPDCSRQQTRHKVNNGFNPRWEETLRFQVRAPELALLRFVVEDHDSTSPNDFVGQFTLPLPSVRAGYRHVHLLSRDGASLAPATLFVHIRCKSL
ncbi:PREDICTED: 1-phosphatidylinositol 4,5-bisphosphate phosphodiesterase delta-3, partial [Chaetura pelagica]|uniref:1-phosphatidylinositol 4,5-bisphosphate phosphodiesterase delta-3 n=1 Tax=Chaetura pelagica TaxID=8897 RepID=UPI0005236B49